MPILIPAPISVYEIGDIVLLQNALALEVVPDGLRVVVKKFTGSTGEQSDRLPNHG